MACHQGRSGQIFQTPLRCYSPPEVLQILKIAPLGTGLLEQHLTLNLATKTSKTWQDFNCKYCGSLRNGWQGPARARAHLSGEKGHDVAACPNVPKDVSKKLLKEAEEKLKQKEHQQHKKRFFLSQQNPDAAAEPALKKQATLDNLQEVLKTELDVSFAEFMYQAGIPFHISQDVMLRCYICCRSSHTVGNRWVLEYLQAICHQLQSNWVPWLSFCEGRLPWQTCEKCRPHRTGHSRCFGGGS